MKTSKKSFNKYDEFVFDGENKLARPFTLRGFSNKQRPIVKNCIFSGRPILHLDLAMLFVISPVAMLEEATNANPKTA